MKINKLRMLASDKGFTLIELMIVIAIIGILAAVAIPNFIAYRDKSYCSAAEKDANGLMATMADYFAIPSNVSWTDSTLASAFPGGKATTGNPTAIFPALSGKNSAEILGPVSAIVVKVKDGSGRCPQDYRTAQTLAGWSGGGDIFYKRMK